MKQPTTVLILSWNKSQELLCFFAEIASGFHNTAKLDLLLRNLLNNNFLVPLKPGFLVHLQNIKEYMHADY